MLSRSLVILALALAVVALARFVRAREAGTAGSAREVGTDTRRALEAKPGLHAATFGAGCFWGVEEAFRRIEGVVATSVGYMGGHAENPSYREVCSGTTGHAEVAQVVFDPEQVGYEGLLEVFWKIHDPTRRNRQGPDIGAQYRSVIFTHSEEQVRLARASLERRQSVLGRERPIATAIEPARTFWRAEEDHQQYSEKTGRGGCPLGL